MLMSIAQQSFSRCVLLFFSSPKSSLFSVSKFVSNSFPHSFLSLSLSIFSFSPSSLSPSSEYPATTWGYSTRSSSISLFLRSPLEQNRFASEGEGSSLISVLHSPSYSLPLTLYTFFPPLSVPSAPTLSLSLSLCWLKYYYYSDLKGIMIFSFVEENETFKRWKKSQIDRIGRKELLPNKKYRKNGRSEKRGFLVSAARVGCSSALGEDEREREKREKKKASIACFRVSQYNLFPFVLSFILLFSFAPFSHFSFLSLIRFFSSSIFSSPLL